MKNKAIFTLLLLLLSGYAWTSQAVAETRLGYGQNCGTMYGDGAWQHNDLPHEMQKCADAFTITRTADTSISGLKYTAGFAYRRGPTASNSEFVDDECHANKQYEGGPIINVYGTLMGQCDRRYFAERIETSVYSFPFTIQPTWAMTKSTQVFFGVGGSLYYAVQKVKWDHNRGVCAIGACDDGVYQRFGFSPYFEIGGSYERIGLTLYYAHSERPREAMQHGMYGILATVRL